MDYIERNITLSFDGAGYEAGDYAVVFANDGAGGSMDWDTSYDGRPRSLFPPPPGEWLGYGEAAYGSSAYGIGEQPISISIAIAAPGAWEFGLLAYDGLGQELAGTPGTAAAVIDLKPAQPGPVGITSYDKDTDALVLDLGQI